MCVYDKWFFKRWYNSYWYYIDLKLQLLNMLKQVGSKDSAAMILTDKNLFYIAVWTTVVKIANFP